MKRRFARLPMVFASAALALTAQTGDVKARAHAHYRAGSQAYMERRFEATIEELRKSLALDANQVGAVRLLGLSYQLTNRLDLAQEQFEVACRLAPKDGESWFFLGRIHYLQNFFDKAASALTSAVKYAPDDPRVREVLGLTLEAMGDSSGAEREYRHALERMQSRQGFYTPYATYGAFLLKQNRGEESQGMLVRAVETMPKNWMARFELAKVHVQADRLELALKQLQAALQCERTEEESRRTQGLLAVVYGRLGRDAEALTAAAAAEQ